MSGNTFGTLFRVTTYGESHGPAIGAVIDGCPAGLEFDHELLRHEMGRRRPGQSKLTTQRQEQDEVEVLSGLFEGRTTGAPIHLLIRNQDQRSKDYSRFRDLYRPSHADFVWEQKYGLRDYRGGGRSSARETAARVAAGAVAKMLLQEKQVNIQAFVSQVGTVQMEQPYQELNLSKAEENPIRCPDPATAEQMMQLIEQVRSEGDSVGGIITCVVQNPPVGLGEPVFGKLHADLARAVMSINATRGFEIGSGFAAAAMRGSQHNDPYQQEEGKVTTATNHSGGIQGGISNGMDIVFRVAFKPTATIAQKQQTVTREGEATELEGKGRHDPCVVPRAVPIVEAMTALVLADHLLLSRGDRV